MAMEKLFENRVKKFLKDQGCWYLKTWGGGQFTRSGIPDLLICCQGRFLGVELKAPNGKPSDLQIYHLNRIHDAGGYAILLYPDAFDEFKELIKALNTGRKTRAEDIYIERWGKDGKIVRY